MMHTQLMKYGFLWIILLVLPSMVVGAQELKILALGDSLTEGYGVEKKRLIPTFWKRLSEKVFWNPSDQCRHQWLYQCKRGLPAEMVYAGETQNFDSLLVQTTG